MKNVVIFGPFVGEFGWELLFWQGWVRKVCKDDFVNSYKIAISYPGREPFYPYVDEFRPLSSEFLANVPSARAFICDGWLNGYPGKTKGFGWDISAIFEQISRGIKPHRVPIEEPKEVPSLAPIAEKMLTKFLQESRFRNSQIKVFTPWKFNKYKDLSFGWRSTRRIQLYGSHSNSYPIPFEEQLLEPLSTPTAAARTAVLRTSNRRRVAVFPRHRNYRREDKNWSRENYLKLIETLMQLGYDVGILGDRSGAHFVNEKLGTVTDLINIPDEDRLERHIDFLSQSDVAVGAMSGATLMALACGTSTVIFGYEEEMDRYHVENFLKTPLTYIPEINPTVNEVLQEVIKMTELQT